jgi:MinD-like ATPase involved in chromosome partitioning or flagellar assembly
VVPGGRLLDEINKERDFIPITNATVYDISGETPLDTLDFVAINKSLVVLVAPSVPG